MIQRFAHILRAGFLAAAVLSLLAVPLHAQGDGAALFKTKCAACHGADGSGDTAMGKTLKIRDLRSADVQKQTDAELTEITTNGKGKMPAYKGKLTDDQIKQLVAAIRDLAKKK
jgi:mono/diheme cytochrome c family protein